MHNPAVDHVIIALPGLGDGHVSHIELWNRQGQLCRYIYPQSGQSQVNIPTTGLSKGLYWVRMWHNKGQETFRVILGSNE